MKRNVLFNVIIVATTTISLFLVFKVIKSSLGAEQFGLWSLILSSISGGKILELGMATTATRYVAMYEFEKSKPELFRVIFTILLIVIILFILGFFPIYLGLQYLFENTIDQEYLEISLNILPQIMIIIFLGLISSVLFGVIEGFKKYSEKLVINVTSSILFVTTLFLFRKDLNIELIANFQIGQLLFTLTIIIPLILSKLEIPNGGLLIQSKSTIKEIIVFGANVQLSGILALLLDPFTKFNISKNFGLIATGNFELITQIVGKLRGLIVSSNQVIIPYLSSNNLKDFHNKVLHLNYLILFPIVATTIVIGNLFFIDVYQMIFTQKIEDEILLYFQIILLAWMLNILVAPLYFQNISNGKVKINTISHIVTGMINVVGCLILIKFNSKLYFIILNYGVAILMGSLFIYFKSSNEKKYSIRLLNSNSPSLKFTLLMTFGIIISFLFSTQILLIRLLCGFLFITYLLKRMYNYYVWNIRNT